MKYYLVCSSWYLFHNYKMEQESKIEKVFVDLDECKKYAKAVKDEDSYKTVYITEVIDELAF